MEFKGVNKRIVSLGTSVQKMCQASIASPVEVARVQQEIENELLALRLLRNQLNRQRTLDYYRIFRHNRWEGDIAHSYNEAAASANAEMASVDGELADLKAYCTYLENLSSILKGFITSHFRD